MLPVRSGAKETYEQLDLFTDYGAQLEQKKKRKIWHGKNGCGRRFWRSRKVRKKRDLKGMNLEEGDSVTQKQPDPEVTRHECVGDIQRYH